MNDTTIAMVGNAATDVRYFENSSGVPVVSFRFASTDRRFDRDRGCWVDGETSFVTVLAFRWLASNVAGSVARGDPLVVTGRMRVREWEREGRRHTSVEVEARSVGHDLARGTSAFRRVVRAKDATSAVSVPPRAAGQKQGQAAGGEDGAGHGGQGGHGGQRRGRGHRDGGGAVREGAG